MDIHIFLCNWKGLFSLHLIFSLVFCKKMLFLQGQLCRLLVEWNTNLSLIWFVKSFRTIIPMQEHLRAMLFYIQLWTKLLDPVRFLPMDPMLDKSGNFECCGYKMRQIITIMMLSQYLELKLSLLWRVTVLGCRPLS